MADSLMARIKVQDEGHERLKRIVDEMSKRSDPLKEAPGGSAEAIP